MIGCNVLVYLFVFVCLQMLELHPCQHQKHEAPCPILQNNQTPYHCAADTAFNMSSSATEADAVQDFNLQPSAIKNMCTG